MSAQSDPSRHAADVATCHALLNCYLREGGPAHWEGDGTRQVVAIVGADDGAQVQVAVRHRSATGHHRFELPAVLREADGDRHELDVPTLAARLVDRLAHGDPRGPGEVATLLARVSDSHAEIARVVEARRSDVERLWGAEPQQFIDTEQALMIGHLLHPTAKSRGEMGRDDRVRYSPEDRSLVRLNWLAVDPEWVVHDSALPESAPTLVRRMLEADPAVDQGALARRLGGLGRRILVPAHPWELAYLRAHDRDVASMLACGAVVDLGPLGSPFTPTSSVRTLYRDESPWQLKFSLHLRVTNSLRVTLPKELRRAVEAARLARTEVGHQTLLTAPSLVVLQDPATLAIRRIPGGSELIDGLSVLLRQNRWGVYGPAAGADASAVTTLCQEHPHGGDCRLGALVRARATLSRRPVDEVARDWFAAYCEVVTVSLIRLYLDLGLCFEPHQQNTVLELRAGLPVRCVVRDSQGYFHREAAHSDLGRVIAGLGEASESIFPEALADERLVYYPFVNNALGVIGALGAADCVDERVLLADLRAVVERERSRGGRYPHTLLDRVLDDERWPAKANLRTRLHDLDELVGDIATQSVYVTIPNPLHPANL